MVDPAVGPVDGLIGNPFRAWLYYDDWTGRQGFGHIYQPDVSYLNAVTNPGSRMYLGLSKGTSISANTLDTVISSGWGTPGAVLTANSGEKEPNISSAVTIVDGYAAGTFTNIAIDRLGDDYRLTARYSMLVVPATAPTGVGYRTIYSDNVIPPNAPFSETQDAQWYRDLNGFTYFNIVTLPGQAVAFGYNYYGQLGIDDGTGNPRGFPGSYTSSAPGFPLAVPPGGPPSNSPYPHFTYRGDLALALRDNFLDGGWAGFNAEELSVDTWFNRTWVYPLNTDQQGKNHYEAVFVETQPATPLTYSTQAVAAGQYHSLKLDTNGTVQAWGSNQYGQLGDGTNADRDQPVTIANLSNVVAISAGMSHSLALVSLNNGGTVWAWGHNGNGQLGNGTNTDQNTPVQVQDPGDPTGFLQNVIAISAGDTFGLALKKDGSLFAWGFNDDGELGINSNVNSNVAGQVSNFTAARLLINGHGHIGGIAGKGPTGDILAVAFSPVDSIDGTTSPTMLATASADYTARVWQWNRTPTTSVTPRTDTNLVSLVAKLDDSVVNPNIPGTGSGAHAHTNTVNGVVFSPDGNYVITVSTDASMKVWNARTGYWLTDISDSSLSGEFAGKAHAGSITSVAATGWTDAGKTTFYLVTGSVERIAKLWQITVNSSANPPVVQNGGSSTIGSIAHASPTTTITAAGVTKATVTTTTGSQIVTYTVHVLDGTNFPNGALLTATDNAIPVADSITGAVASGGGTTALVLSNTTITGNPVLGLGNGTAVNGSYTLVNITAPPAGTVFPKGAWVSASDATRDSILGQIASGGGTTALVLSANGLQTAGTPALIPAGTAISWKGPAWTIRDQNDVDNLVSLPGGPANSYYKTLLASVNGVAIYNNTSTGNLEIYAAGADSSYDTNIIPNQYFFDSKKWEYKLSAPPGPAYDTPTSPAKTFLSPDPGSVVNGVSKVATPAAYGHTGSITSLAVSQDGKYLVTGSYDWSAKVWNTSDSYVTDQPLFTFQSAVTQPTTGHRAVVNSVAISPDDNYVVTASEDRTVKRWYIGAGNNPANNYFDKTLYNTTAGATAVAYPTVFGASFTINRAQGPNDTVNAYDVILSGGRADPNYEPGNPGQNWPGQADLVILPRVVSMSGGSFHGVAATEYGYIWAWGLDNNGQLGDNDNTYADQLYPVKVYNSSAGNPQLNLIVNPNPLVPPAVDFLLPGIQVAAGNDHSLALDNNSNVWSWGDNLFGECGDGTHDVSVTPHVPGKQHLTAIQVMTLLNNSNQTYFTVSAGSWTDSSKTLTQIGAFANYTFAPGDKITIYAGDHNVDHVIAGTCAIAGKTDSDNITLTASITGGNDVTDGSIAGFLNNSSGVSANDPNNVPLGNIVGISAGWGYSLARDNQGIMWGWGHNNNGQLGNDDGEYARNMDTEGADQTYAIELTLYRVLNHPDTIQPTFYDSISSLFPVGTPPALFNWIAPPGSGVTPPGPPVWQAGLTSSAPSLRSDIFGGMIPAHRWDAAYSSQIWDAASDSFITRVGVWGGDSPMSSFSAKYWHSLGITSPKRYPLNWSVDPPRDPVTGLGAGGVVAKGDVLYNATDVMQTPQSGVANEAIWTWNPDNSGMITADAGTVSYLRAIPNPGFRFDHWEGNFAGGPNAQGDTVQAWSASSEFADSSFAVRAFFVAQTRQFQLAVTAVDTGGNPLPQAGILTGGGSYNENSEVVISAKAASAGYSFLYWLGDPDINNLQGTQDIYGNGSYKIRVIMTQNWNIQAVFGVNNYSLTLLSNPSNASTPTGGGTYSYGTSVTIDAPANPSWTFNTWTVTLGPGQVVSNNIPGDPSNANIIVDNNITLTANFTQQFTINVIIPQGAEAGTVNGQTPSYTTTVPAGTPVVLTAVASGAPWFFVNWTGDVSGGIRSGGGTILTLPAAFISTSTTGTLNIQANFSNGSASLSVQSTPISSVPITSSSGQGGTTPYTPTVVSNELVSLTAPATWPPGGTPATAYYFLYWTLNGTQHPPGTGTLSFNMPASGTAVAAYELDATPPAVSGMSPAPSSIQNAPDTVIQLQATDSESGVDFTTVTISVEGNVIYNGAAETAAGVYQTIGQAVSGICYRTGTPNDYTFYFEPTTVFYNEQLVHVVVNASDLAGNVMTPLAYTFTVQMRTFSANLQVNTDAGGAQHRPATLTDPAGNLWMVWDNGSQVWIGESPVGSYAFGASTAVSTTGGTQTAAAIALNPAPTGGFYVVWQDNRSSPYEIRGATSPNGTTWTQFANPLGVTGAAQTNPTIALDSAGKIYVAWEDMSPGVSTIFVTYSTNNGATWQKPFAVSPSATAQTHPSLAIDSANNVYLVWSNASASHGNDIFGATSTNGNTWSLTTVVSNSFSHTAPALVAETAGSVLHLAWVGTETGNEEIYYAATTGGLPVSPLTGVNVVDDANDNNGAPPAIAVSGLSSNSTAVAYLAWEDSRNVSTKNPQDTDIYFCEVRSGIPGTNILVNDDTNLKTQQNPCMSVVTLPGVDINGQPFQGQPYIGWEDNRPGSFEIWFAATAAPSTSSALSISRLVPQAGGTVGPLASGARVVIPAGALQTWMSIGSLTSIAQVVATPDQPAGALGNAFAFGPSGLEFLRPVTITIPIPATAPAFNAYQAYWYNPLTGVWSNSGISNVTFNAATNSVSFTSDHFTTFSVTGTGKVTPVPPPPTPGGGGGGGHGCFIAASAYEAGFPDLSGTAEVNSTGRYFISPERLKKLNDIRGLRDELLLSVPEGRVFSAWYYALAPYPAMAIRNNEPAKSAVRAMVLNPLSELLRNGNGEAESK